MKSRNLPTFMIASNPMVTNGLYVVHTKEPYFIAEIVSFKTMEGALEYESNLPIGGRTVVKGKYYVLNPQMILRTESITNDEGESEKLAKLFRRAADWVHAYLKSMDDTKE